MKKILVTIPVREKDRKFLEEKGKEFQFCYRTKEEITVSDVVDAEIILGNIPVELVPKAKKLKFLQLDSAGSTEYTASGVLMPDTKLANATAIRRTSCRKNHHHGSPLQISAITAVKRLNFGRRADL